MPRVYATADQVWPDGAPANADRLLRAASRVVDLLLAGVVYDVDTAKMPTDPDVVECLQDAVAAIAVEAEAQGLLDAGSTQKWESVAIGSVQLSDLQGASSSDTPYVAGLPVPPAARLALSELGPVTVAML